MDLQSPSVLAQLPRPLHASTGKTHIGDVYSLADSKKRKRYEVVVAVDGEAVNIYNVRLRSCQLLLDDALADIYRFKRLNWSPPTPYRRNLPSLVVHAQCAEKCPESRP